MVLNVKLTKVVIPRILDKQEQVIGYSHGTTFQWESVSITWQAKSLGLITDPTSVPFNPILPSTSLLSHLACFNFH